MRLARAAHLLLRPRGDLPGEIVHIVFYPDPILRRHAQPVASIDDAVRERVAEMFQLMYEEKGVGLAAPQVGWSVRLFVMNALGQESPEGELVLINPRILSADGSETDEEGCLSIPDVRGDVERRLTVEVEAQGLDGALFRREFEGLEARVVQHENDHLDGILFIQRLAESERLGVRKRLKELEKEYRKSRAGAVRKR